MRRDTILWVLLAILGVACLALVLNQDGRIVGLGEDEFASLVYLGTIGFGMAAALFLFSRTGLGQALRHLLVWIAVFAAVLAAYAFAPEMIAIKDRVMAVLVPGSVVALPNDGEHAQYLVTRGADGHFHLTGEVDGRPASFMVDTGASVIAMDTSTARSLGFHPDDLSFTNFVQTANGVARSAPIILDSVKVGDIERRNVRAAVTESDGLGTILLGMSFLDTLTSYDFRGNRLILTD
ncbi:TIGR02281 family clan AA aspartic protease [Fulvimarina endophytica]|uniref:TIGR02281 family clan AA aspartic protease n=1 Tax=Fulvimarina endophytica TaxID=2293836 RepID=A0A371X7K3_9HYPH|nr:TIGR02281 family clan AA aspartic protease [Fulvimarina endophytica]RFC65171.1 TIGR02281 family clan AA aspartic protease [Fulvimarina endophytica]